MLRGLDYSYLIIGGGNRGESDATIQLYHYR